MDKKKILFIEDEPSLQKATSSFFLDEGYEILSAMDGENGINLAKEKNPDIILLDLILPKKDGFEVMQELKQNPDTKNIPIIILSNLDTSADVDRALELGATTYLVKTNYKLEEIIQKIKNILG